MKTNWEQRLGDNVRSARRRAGIRKGRFCLAAGIARPTLDHIEAGEANITMECLGRIARALGTEPWKLLR